MSISQIVERLMPFCAVRGREEPYLQAAYQQLLQYSVAETNHLYTVARFQGRGEKRKKVMLLAHCATPGYLASKICDGGMVQMIPIDGVGNVNPVSTWTPPFLPVEAETVGKNVVIYGEKMLEAIVPAPPVHYQSSVGKLAKADGIYAVTGFTKEQLERMVVIGDAVTYAPYVRRTRNSKFFGPFLEYRLPSALLIRIAERMAEEKPYHDVSIAICGGSNFSGAVQAVKAEQPDELIIISTTQAESYKGQGVKDDGSVVQFFGSAIHYGFSQTLEEKLIALGARHQRVASVFTTDTPADECGYVDEGYPTAMFAIPVQYSRSGISQAKEDSAEYLAEQLSFYLTGEEE